MSTLILVSHIIIIIIIITGVQESIYFNELP